MRTPDLGELIAQLRVSPLWPYANFARNQALVDRSDKVLSYRKYASNGTEDCIERAKMKLKYLVNVTAVST